MKQTIDELHAKVTELEQKNYELSNRLSQQIQMTATAAAMTAATTVTSTQQFSPKILDILHGKITETKRNIWVCFFSITFYSFSLFLI